MLRALSGVTVLIGLTAVLGGCAVIDGFQAGASTAQTCERSVEILGDMSDVTLLLATNPFGYETYAVELRGLAAELASQEPRDPELKDAVNSLGGQVSGLLDSLESDDVSLGDLSSSLAEIQLEFLSVSALCQSALD